MEALIAVVSFCYGIYLVIEDLSNEPEVKFTEIRIHSDGRICRYSRADDHGPSGPEFIDLDS